MSDDPAPPPVAVKRRRGISFIWLIPVIAAGVGLWLAWLTISEKGPEITVTFETAEGLEEGKTKIKFKDVDVGTVDKVNISPDLSHIVAHAMMVKGAERYLKQNTQFWVVRPQIGIGGVSGLSTLLSGSYIGIDPGEGESEPALAFTGLEEAPVLRSNVPGKEFVLHADEVNSLSRGAPVYYRGIAVGQILGRELAGDKSSLDVKIFVNAPYDQLVHHNSRFWNASGIDFAITSGGVEVQVASLQSLLVGGVSFETPRVATNTKFAEAGRVFTLYQSHNELIEAGFTEKISLISYFTGSVGGLKAGAPVEFHGIRVGTVNAVNLELLTETMTARIAVTYDVEPGRVTEAGKQLVDQDPYVTLAMFLEKGMRAQPKVASFLSGDLLIALDFFPDPREAPVELTRVGGDGGPVLVPSMPNTLDELTTTAQSLVKQLPALFADARKLIESVNALVTSPEIKQTLASLDASMVSVQNLAGNLDRQAGPMISSLRVAADKTVGAVEQAQATLSSANDIIGKQSQSRSDLTSMIKELSNAARSIRVFADYLERHPEALIRGKGPAGR